MNPLDQIPLSKLAGYSFSCECNNQHELATKHILFERGATAKLISVVQQVMSTGKILLVTQEGASAACARQVQERLQQAGYAVICHIFDTHVQAELSAGLQLINYPEDVRLVVVVGGGTITDIVRYAASMQQKPYLVMPTAPSNIGYLSSHSLFLVDGGLQLFEATPPFAVVCDMEFILDAPRAAAIAGFGELMSLQLSLFDSYVRYAVYGQKYCAILSGAIQVCCERVASVNEAFERGDTSSLYVLMENLLRVSLILQMNRNIDLWFGGAQQCAVSYRLLAKKQQLHLPHFGITEFLMATKLTGLYQLFVTHTIEDVLSPVDKGLRSERLSQWLGVDAHTEMIKMSAQDNLKQYAHRMFCLEEYREDLASMLFEALQQMLCALKTFKRTLLESGNFKFNSLQVSLLKPAVAIAPDLCGQVSLLSIMRDMGLLDQALSQ